MNRLEEAKKAFLEVRDILVKNMRILHSQEHTKSLGSGTGSTPHKKLLRF